VNCQRLDSSLQTFNAPPVHSSDGAAPCEGEVCCQTETQDWSSLTPPLSLRGQPQAAAGTDGITAAWRARTVFCSSTIPAGRHSGAFGALVC